NFTNLYYIFISKYITFILTLKSQTREGEQHVVVTTRLGKVRGFESHILGHRVQSFLGIPFAEPPIGEYRFRPPRVKKPWNNVLDATNLSPACFQGRDNYNTSFWGSEMWNANTEVKEDCLYLNIWKPASHNLKVMVWIFGGGFYSGSPSLLLYDGKALAVKADAIIVNINYRLGPFGYLYFDHEEAPGNVGMLDQQLALTWIRKYVSAFGGDPSQMTLFGESAGASSIVAHMIAPGSLGLFRNGILQSGSLDNNWAMISPMEALNRSRAYARRIKCEKNDVTAPAASLIDRQWDGLGFLEFPVAIVSKDRNFFMDRDAFVSLRNGKYAKLLQDSMLNLFLLFKLVINFNYFQILTKKIFMLTRNFWNIYNLAEYFDTATQPLIDHQQYLECTSIAFAKLPAAFRRGAMWTYNKNCSQICSRSKAYADMVNQMVGDFYFTCDSLWFAEEYRRIGNGKIFIYYFDQPSSANPWPKWTGVMHGYEIEFVFGVPLFNKTAGYSAREVHFSEKIIEYWKSFAETGVPRLKGTTKRSTEQWPEYRESGKWMYLKGGSLIHPTESRKKDECTVWRQAKDWQYYEYCQLCFLLFLKIKSRNY
uniref:Carboxylic ester hydrolase n=1 Tax=Syphacia muris TaxID=451379 RepID=A0A0N5AG41_9BILA